MIPIYGKIDHDYYIKHAYASFQDGYHYKLKTKRHYQTKYDQYQYWLPAKISKLIRFLKEYFKCLDFQCNVPDEFKFRQTEFEFAETALSVLNHIRCRIAVNNPIVIGSRYVSPCPWAVFGTSEGIVNKLIRYRFRSIEDIFDHYKGLLESRLINIINIDRPMGMDEDDDKALFLSNIFDKPPNYILTTAILLTTDIIKNAGPDCDELKLLFSNDKRSHISNLPAWRFARDEIICKNAFDLESFLRYDSIRNFQKYQPQPVKMGYWDVEVRDANISAHLDLLDGEVFELYEQKPTSQRRIIYSFSDIGSYECSHIGGDICDDSDEAIHFMEQKFEELEAQMNQCYSE